MCSAVLNEMEDEEASLIRKKNSVLLTIMKQIYFGRNSKRDFPLSSLKSKRFCLFLFYMLPHIVESMGSVFYSCTFAEFT